MLTPRLLLRQCLLATSSLCLALPANAQAQTAAPPARVGQIASVSGGVSYNGAGSSGQWIAATRNYPITSGDSLFTQNGAEAAIALNASRLTLGANTEVQITALDDAHFAATESQGEVFLTLSALQPGQSFTLATPRGTVSLSQAGEYDINAGDAQTPTTVAVLAGAASIGQMQVPAGQEAVLSGTEPVTAQLAPLQHDAFIDHVLTEMAPPPPPYAAPLVQQMTGVEELSAYGSWAQSPEYGAIWYPYVGTGWVPFREGQWAYVAPWGWTWVDAEPWGFAPFHYGRWIDADGRWGWVPSAAYAPGYDEPYAQPVYAPAVVGFFGLAAGAVLTASLLASHSVGWVPLAPGEPFYPFYHVSPDYLRRINREDMRHFDPDRHENFAIDHFANRHAATFIPAEAMARGAPMAHFGQPMTPAMFGQAHPVEGVNQALRPAIPHQQAAAPHPTAFSARHDVPAPVIAHTPAEAPHAGFVPFHPGPELRPQGPGIHPPTPAVAQPPAPQFHQPVPQVSQPHEAPPVRPPAPQFHQPMPIQQFHQPMPQFHPEAPHAPPPPRQNDLHHP